MPDREKVVKALEQCARGQLRRKADKYVVTLDIRFVNSILELLKEQEYKDRMFHALEDDWKAMLKEQEAVKPRVSSVEQRCGNCNKVIEMDGWEACPWCGKPILWEAVGRSVK